MTIDLKAIRERENRAHYTACDSEELLRDLDGDARGGGAA